MLEIVSYIDQTLSDLFVLVAVVSVLKPVKSLAYIQNHDWNIYFLCGVCICHIPKICIAWAGGRLIIKTINLVYKTQWCKVHSSNMDFFLSQFCFSEDIWDFMSYKNKNKYSPLHRLSPSGSYPALQLQLPMGTIHSPSPLQ